MLSPFTDDKKISIVKNRNQRAAITSLQTAMNIVKNKHLIVPTFASIIILSKKAFKEVVKSLFAENKEPPIIFNKNVAITRERPELKKKNNINNNTIIRTKRNLIAVVIALELGKLGAWSLGFFVAAVVGNTATTVIDQEIRESYAQKAEARIANRLKSAKVILLLFNLLVTFSLFLTLFYYLFTNFKQFFILFLLEEMPVKSAYHAR